MISDVLSTIPLYYDATISAVKENDTEHLWSRFSDALPRPICLDRRNVAGCYSVGASGTSVPYPFYTGYNMPPQRCSVTFKRLFLFSFLHSLSVHLSFSRMANIALINESLIASLNVINRMCPFSGPFAIKLPLYTETHRW